MRQARGALGGALLAASSNRIVVVLNFDQEIKRKVEEAQKR